MVKFMHIFTLIISPHRNRVYIDHNTGDYRPGLKGVSEGRPGGDYVVHEQNPEPGATCQFLSGGLGEEKRVDLPLDSCSFAASALGVKQQCPGGAFAHRLRPIFHAQSTG